MSGAFSSPSLMRRSWATDTRDSFSRTCFTVRITEDCFFFCISYLIFLIKCTWQYCHAAPRKDLVTDSCIPLWSLEITSFTSLIPFSFRSSKNDSHSISVSESQSLHDNIPIFPSSSMPLYSYRACSHIFHPLWSWSMWHLCIWISWIFLSSSRKKISHFIKFRCKWWYMMCILPGQSLVSGNCISLWIHCMKFHHPLFRTVLIHLHSLPFQLCIHYVYVHPFLSVLWQPPIRLVRVLSRNKSLQSSTHPCIRVVCRGEGQWIYTATSQPRIKPTASPILTLSSSW